MTIQEFHYDFLFKIDKVASLSREDFKPEEIDWFLNEAQRVLIKTKYEGLNPSRTGFEMTQKRIDDLSTIVVKYPEEGLITPTSLGGGVYEVPLASLTHPYWFFIRGSVEVSDTNCTIEVPLKLIQHDDLSSVINDPFNNSSDEWILFNFGRSNGSSNTSIYLYPGTLTIDNFKIEYIKKPERMSLGTYQYIDAVTYPAATSELPEQVHTEIVDLAVQIAAGIIENPDYLNMKTQKVLQNG